MQNKKTYYQILHVQPDAPLEVIRSSYRTMMQKLKMHPDLGGCHENAAEVNEAYNVLTNPAKRSEYDASLLVNANTKKPRHTKEKKRAKPNQTTQKFYQNNNAEICSFCNQPHYMGINIEPNDICPKCESPLFPATKQTEEICGKRTIQRINKEWPLRFYISWPHTESFSGKTRNVSFNGMQLVTAAQLEINQVIKIDSNELYAVARIVNHQQFDQEWRYGLEFLTLRFHQAHGTFVSLEI